MSNWSVGAMISSLPSLSATSLGLREFSSDEILKATNNFDQSLLLRRGWMSQVYKGTYEDYDGKTRTVTIKGFTVYGTQWEEGTRTWFQQQLEAWSQFRHEHVVSVIGYCIEAGYNIVVYEYLENGSLAQHLRKKITPSSFSLSFEQCLQICIDTAKGLEYMHNNIKYSKGQLFVHADVGPNNILLDENGVAKISDLCYEPIAGLNDDSACYFDPESHSARKVSQSSDVYSFGVLLFKVMSRTVSDDGEDKDLGITLNSCIEHGIIQSVAVHPETKSEISPDSLKNLVDIAGECLVNESAKRPSITQVVKKLEFLMAPSSSFKSREYSLHEIKEATNDFSSKCFLGEGGEGKVYKGIITDTNTSFAVKRLKPELSSESKKEIEMLSLLDHPNLISLVGYCHESDENILIYELMSNGDLFQSLYNSANPLSWTQRIKICIGAARGLRYLHASKKTSRKGIIHRDVKPVNILLDEKFNAKISDFGLSKMGPQDQQNSEIATLFKGTIGYFAPEYQKYGKITRKIDVYAFGVVLTEVLCQKKPWERNENESFYPGNNEKYSVWAKENIDPNLKGKIAPVCLEAFALLLEICLNKKPKRRPTMNEVVSVLEYAEKWQEAWEMQKSGEEFCLPGRKDLPVLYCISKSQSSIAARLILRRYAIVDERDLAFDMCLRELRQALGDTVDINIPQLFLQGKHVGDISEFGKLCATGKLSEMLGLPLPQFNCDTCQNAKTCDICTQKKRYVHCNNCGEAIIVAWKQWEGQLRTCFECNAGQLTCDVITFTFS